jgi:hypothetical protein
VRLRAHYVLRVTALQVVGRTPLVPTDPSSKNASCAYRPQQQERLLCLPTPAARMPRVPTDPSSKNAACAYRPQQLALSYIRTVHGTLLLLYVRLSVGPHSGGTCRGSTGIFCTDPK